jgi:uncharacterized protein involved in exopolysaccharide biosynthesis
MGTMTSPERFMGPQPRPSPIAGTLPESTSGPGDPPLTFSVWIAGVMRRRRTVLATLAATIALAVLAGLVIPPVYRAHSSFVANSSSARMSGAMSGGGLFSGLASQLGLNALRDPSESPNFYAQLIASEELRRRLARTAFPNPRTEAPADSATLVDILRIRNRDPERRLEIAVTQLRERILRVEVDPTTNLVTINAHTRWPELSAQLADRAVELVTTFNREQRVSRASTKREFLQTRAAAALEDLRTAEERQRQFYEQNRAWRNAPSLMFEEARLRRNVDLASDLYVTLRQQYEVARLEEFDDAALITVVDQAVVPRKPQWPRWGVLLVSASVLGVMLGVVVAGSGVILADWRTRKPDLAEFVRDAAPRPLRRFFKPRS